MNLLRETHSALLFAPLQLDVLLSAQTASSAHTWSRSLMGTHRPDRQTFSVELKHFRVVFSSSSYGQSTVPSLTCALRTHLVEFWHLYSFEDWHGSSDPSGQSSLPSSTDVMLMHLPVEAHWNSVSVRQSSVSSSSELYLQSWIPSWTFIFPIVLINDMLLVCFCINVCK